MSMKRRGRWTMRMKRRGRCMDDEDDEKDEDEEYGEKDDEEEDEEENKEKVEAVVVVVVDASRAQSRFKTSSTVRHHIFVRIMLKQWNCKLETSPVWTGPGCFYKNLCNVPVCYILYYWWRVMRRMKRAR